MHVDTVFNYNKIQKKTLGCYLWLNILLDSLPCLGCELKFSIIWSLQKVYSLYDSPLP